MNDFPLKIANKKALNRRRLAYGVGINDAFYVVNQTINGKPTRCPIYQSWVHMLERCYCPKLKATRTSYKECRVVKEWLVFSCFREWVLKQDYQGKELDKDLMIPGNKEYGPETCVFVSSSINLLLSKPRKKRSLYPTGVQLDKDRKKFSAYCHIDGKARNLGRFFTEADAARRYREAKSEYVAKLAILQGDMRIRNGLLAHSNMILNGAEC